MQFASGADIAEILVVDDTPTECKFLAEILAAQGYRVRTAVSGEEALKAVSDAPPDLILLDINMPSMDGFEVCRQLKQEDLHASIPVIFISIYDDTKTKVEAFNCGGIDYVTKPVNVAEIRARIHAHLEMKRAHDRLGFQAGHDPLTGLPNRSLLSDRLQQAISYAERYGSQVAVAYLDLDKFKGINDRLGHKTGDHLLVEVAQRLLSCVRESDTVARLGGDEFVVIFYDQANENAAMHAMQRILDRIAEPINVDGYSLTSSCSIGFACYPQDGCDADTLLKNADAAMYRAKELGRNNFQFFTSELNNRINEHIVLERSLRRALADDEFVLHYQPRIELRSGRVVALEALIRWRHPERGLLPPMTFIPVAEEAGLIERIGEWVLRSVCRQLRQWSVMGVAQVPVSINVSAHQFLRPGLARALAAILQEEGVEAGMLELEFKESLLMNDPETTIQVLRELQTIGIGLTIDDFGTGFSNLGYLKKFRVDRIKLDPSFVDQIERQPDDLALADAVIGIAHSLRLKVSAEGIESGSQLALLADRGCDEMQGDYFSPAVPVEVCTALMLENRMLSVEQLLRRKNRRTLLVIDSDADARSMLTGMAKLAGYRLIEAVDAEQAFEALAEQEVGIILCEQKLDDMSGVEFLSRVRYMYPATIRIMLAAGVDTMTATSAVNQAGVFKVLQKPWKQSELSVILDAAFMQYESDARPIKSV